MYNFLLAFVVCGGAVIIGELVSTWSKAWIPSVFVTACLLLVGYWTILPPTLVTDSKLVPFGSTLAVFILITHMGTVISLQRLIEQWKTVVVCLSGLFGMCVVCYFVGPYVMDRAFVIAGLPPLTGGIVAATMMQTAAAEKGLMAASVFAITMYCVQGFAGYPITSVCLKREGERLIKEFREGRTKTNAEDLTDVKKVVEISTGAKKGILRIPDRFNSPIVILTKLGLVAYFALLFGMWTGVSGAVWALVFGVVFNYLGFLDADSLHKSNSYNILMFALMMYVFDGLKDCTPEMLTNIIGPMILLIVLGLIGMSVLSVVVAKVLKLSFYLAYANCLTALYGFPFDAIITEATCDSIAKNQEEKDFLMSRMFPSMIVGGFVTVTITSVVIAGIFVKLL